MNRWNRKQAEEAAPRDRAMAADYLDGMTHRELAEKYGLKPMYVGQRLSKIGVTLSDDERRNRGIIARQASDKIGRKRVWPDCPPELHAEYMWLRNSKNIPAAEARRMLEGAL